MATLTPTETKVLGLAAQGLLNKQIGIKIEICEGTVKCHFTNIFKKLGALNRANAVAIGLTRRLIAFEEEQQTS